MAKSLQVIAFSAAGALERRTANSLFSLSEDLFGPSSAQAGKAAMTIKAEKKTTQFVICRVVCMVSVQRVEDGVVSEFVWK